MQTQSKHLPEAQGVNFMCVSRSNIKAILMSVGCCCPPPIAEGGEGGERGEGELWLRLCIVSVSAALSEPRTSSNIITMPDCSNCLLCVCVGSFSARSSCSSMLCSSHLPSSLKHGKFCITIVSGNVARSRFVAANGLAFIKVPFMMRYKVPRQRSTFNGYGKLR